MADAGVWVLAEKPTALAELLAGARELAERLGGPVAGVVVGPRTGAELAVEWGADEVLWLQLPAGRIFDDSVDTLEGLVADRKPALILVGVSKRARVVAGRLAARLGATVITDVSRFGGDGTDLQAIHMVYGGGAVRTERPKAGVMIATVGPGTFQAVAAPDGHQGKVTAVAWVKPKWEPAVIDRRQKPPSSVNLAAARKVVCVGRGIQKKDDMLIIEVLAKVLGAEIGCTRPVAEGLNILPHECYIGVSGATVRPDLYLSAGVSGQVQHTFGIGDSKIIVAIDKDKSAPIFKQCDYGIVGDLYKVVPALTKALEALKRGKLNGSI